MQIIVLALVVAAAVAAPQSILVPEDLASEQPEVKIVSQKFDQDQAGNYEYSYELDNGQRVEEVGRFQPGPEPETGSLEKQGSYEYVGDDSNIYQISYLANEDGFQPLGAHLPQPPAQIPEYDQLRQDYPQLFWAENGGADIIPISQQLPNFVDEPIDEQ